YENQPRQVEQARPHGRRHARRDRRSGIPGRPQHDPPGSAQGPRSSAAGRNQAGHGRTAEDRFTAQDHHGRLAGVGHPVSQVLQRRGQEARAVVSVFLLSRLAFLVVILAEGGDLLLALAFCYTDEVATESSSVPWRYGVTG